MGLNDIKGYLEIVNLVAQILTPFIAAGAAWLVVLQIRSYRHFEIIRHLESPEVRDARRIVMMEIPKRAGTAWWDEDQRLHKAAALVASVYDHIGGVLLTKNIDGLKGLFIRRWGSTMVTCHVNLKSFLEMRRELQKNAYEYFTKISTIAEKVHPDAARAHRREISPPR